MEFVWAEIELITSTLAVWDQSLYHVVLIDLNYLCVLLLTLCVVQCSPFHQPLSLPVLLSTATRSPAFKLICEVAVAA